MSQERREQQKENLGIESAASRKWRRIGIYAVLIVAAFGLAYYLANRAQHKHDSFARCLTERGVKMYGAWWCPHCVEQKETFGASFEYVPYGSAASKATHTGSRRFAKTKTSSIIPPGSFRQRANEWSALSLCKS